MSMREVAIPIAAWNGPNPNQGIRVAPTTMRLLKIKRQPITKKYRMFSCNRTEIRDGRSSNFIRAALEVMALYNANPKRMNSYTVAGTHNAH